MTTGKSRHSAAGSRRFALDRRPRVLLVVTHPITARYLMKGQLAYLSANGFEVTLVSGPGPGLAAIESLEGIECRTVPLAREISPLRDLRSLFQLTILYRERQPDIVCSSTPKAGLLGMLAAFLARLPRRVYLVRGLRLETVHGWRRTLLAMSEKVAAACADNVVFVSSSLQEKYLRMGLCALAKASVIANGSSHGVDVERFHPPVRNTESSPKDPAKNGPELLAPGPVIGFVGRLVRNKGIGDLVDAMTKDVLPRFPTARLLVVGDFEPGDPVPEEARSFLREHPAVTCTGFVDDSAPWYRRMDVLALPSYREGFPNAAMEAAATALPTVGYAATGTVDAVVHGVTGTLVETGNRRSLGQALCRYLEDADLRRKHGSAARARATELFSQETVWEAWRDFLYSLLERNAP